MLIEMRSADPGFWHLAHFTNCDSLALVFFDKPRRREGRKEEEEDKSGGYTGGFGMSFPDIFKKSGSWIFYLFIVVRRNFTRKPSRGRGIGIAIKFKS
jgi:hypothetical protein